MKQLLTAVFLLVSLGAFGQTPPSGLEGAALRSWIKTNFYDGRRDMVEAVKRLTQLACKGELLPADVSEHQGSWIGHWIQWLHDKSLGDWVPAPTEYGNESYPEIDPAPGRYVLES